MHGSILAPQRKGTNKLIQKDAHPLLSVSDLMRTLDITCIGEQETACKIMPGDPTETKPANVLGVESLQMDEIRSQSELPIENVSAALALMELKEMVHPVGGKNNVTVREVQSEYRVER